MIGIEQAKQILDKVTSDCQPEDNLGISVERNNYYFAIYSNNKLRWIVPENPDFGQHVLIQWKPYGKLSGLKWKVFVFLYRLRIIKFIWKVFQLPIIEGKLLCLPNSEDRVIPVIYVGTPGPLRKAVVTLVSIDSGNPLSVMKVALEDGAIVSLSHEAEVLSQLEKNGMDLVPALLHIDLNKQRTWQTVLDGPLSARELTQNHINWLSQLPESGEYTTFDEQARYLFIELEKLEDITSSREKQFLREIIGKVNGNEEIPLVLVHGDFAPWNIKKKKDGSLLVLDWEDANFTGLPLWDFCHFYLIQACLFKEPRLIQLLKNERIVSPYLKHRRISSQNMQILILLYFLRQIITEEKINSLYRDFLLYQLFDLEL